MFWRRRISTSMHWRISVSRPTIGSILPARASSVTSTVNLASAPPRCIAGEAGCPSSTATAALPLSTASGEPAVIAANSSKSRSRRIFSSSGEMPASVGARSASRNTPASRCPKRMRSSSKRMVAANQPCSTALRSCAEKVGAAPAPPGRRSSVRERSRSSRAGSTSKWSRIRCRSEAVSCSIAWIQCDSSTKPWRRRSAISTARSRPLNGIGASLLYRVAACLFAIVKTPRQEWGRPATARRRRPGRRRRRGRRPLPVPPAANS